jgi:hypothetical protein
MNQNLEHLEGMVNLFAGEFNRQVMEAYAGKDERVKNQVLVRPGQDTPIMVLLKAFYFYLVADRLPTAVVPSAESRMHRRMANIIVGELRLKPDRKLVNGRKPGYYQIHIPHMHPDKWETLRGYEHQWGNVTMVYGFDSQRQIKVNVIDEAAGHKAINHLLKAVDPEWLLGSSEQHSYLGKQAKDKPPARMTGQTGRANRIAIHYSDERKPEKYLI